MAEQREWTLKGCAWLLEAQQAIPLMDQLAAHGRELEAQGKLEVEHGKSYAVADLADLLQK